MSRIVPAVDEAVVARTAARCRERGIRIPTFAEMRDPSLVPEEWQARLGSVPLSAVDPVNLLRITWKNDVTTGRYGAVNALEIPRAITGIRARVIGLVGERFPTGAHKVGAAFGCLVPRLVTGAFDPDRHKAVWPSTGNYCRGGAFDSVILGCVPVAVLPENMSQERFAWLEDIGAEVIATPGSESNVKEIYDKCWELKRDPRHVVFNQFEEFGNPLWHYHVTGPAVAEAFADLAGPGERLAAYVSATGSAGTLAAGDYLKTVFPHVMTVAAEAQQCPTLLENGFGEHRIEGIGDKHVPWVHHVRATDAVAAVDDEDCLRLLRLFNEPAGLAFLETLGLSADEAASLSLLGISGICNLLAAIKTAKAWQLTERDVVFTIFTDSVDLYRSRLGELTAAHGELTTEDAATAYVGSLERQQTDHFKELTQADRRAIHHLKYFTWVEQQGRSHQELLAQWEPEYWEEIWAELGEVDRLIEAFNARVTP